MKTAQPITTNQLLYEEAKLLVDFEHKIKALEEKVHQLEERADARNYTIGEFAALRGVHVDVNKATLLDRKAATLSGEYGFDIQRVEDCRSGIANAYHHSILATVFEDEHIR